MALTLLDAPDWRPWAAVLSVSAGHRVSIRRKSDQPSTSLSTLSWRSRPIADSDVVREDSAVVIQV